eukprot:Selendium_serpulae@DN4871_c0_g1_i1.p1
MVPNTNQQKLIKGLPPEKKWTKVHETYTQTRYLGQGTYGQVAEGRDVNTGQRVAMKRSHFDTGSDEFIPPSAVREISLMKDLNHHPNVVKMHGVSCNSSRVYMIIELAELDLKKYLKEKNRGIPLDVVRTIMKQVFSGLSWCHGCNILHRDLKPQNILMNRDHSVKLADFGLARAGLAPGKTLTHEVITLWYRPPELLLGGCKYTESVDMWAAGCVLAELLEGRPIFQGDSEIDTLFRMFTILGTPTVQDWPDLVNFENAADRDQWPAFPLSKASESLSLLREGIDADAVDLLSKLLAYNPDKRISAKDAVNHQFFKTQRHRVTIKERSQPITNSGSSPNDVASASAFPPRKLVQSHNAFMPEKFQTKQLEMSQNSTRASSSSSVSDLFDVEALRQHQQYVPVRPQKRQNVVRVS